MHPPSNLPPFIRTDASNAFAHNTMRLRHPQMIREVIDANPDYADFILNDLAMLRNDILNDAPILMLNLFPTPPPDYIEWASAHVDHREPTSPSSNPTWLGTDWFFAETALFRIIIELTRWWETRRDPYQPIKHRELESPALWRMLAATQQLSGGVYDRLGTLATYATWGNRIDLSYAAAAELGAETTSDDDLIVNQSDAFVEHMLRAQLKYFPDERRGFTHIIADNAGTELAMDLALSDALLTGFSDVVVLHLKYHPTFVSDATTDDVYEFIRRCVQGEHGNEDIYSEVIDLGERLQGALYEGRLRLAPSLFWNSSRFMWEMPIAMERVFENNQIVIVKGDANYRRLVGDCLWDTETPFEEVVSYFPSSVIALRTLKSDPIVGLDAGVAESLIQQDLDWRVNGKRGVIQIHSV